MNIPRKISIDFFADQLEPHHEQLRLVARHLARNTAEGDDIFHEAVLRGIVKIDLLRDPASFRSWFYRILLNVHRNRYRSSFWKRIKDDVVIEDISIPSKDVMGAHRLRRALATLDAKKREAFVLHEVCGYDVKETAAILRVTPSAAKSRLSRARRKLQKHYPERQNHSHIELSEESATLGGLL